VNFQEASDIARRHPGSVVRRADDGSFVVLDSNNATIVATDQHSTPGVTSQAVSHLQKENQQLRDRLNALETEVVDARIDGTARIAELEEKIKQLKRELSDSISSRAQLESRIRELEEQPKGKVMLQDSECNGIIAVLSKQGDDGTQWAKFLIQKIRELHAPKTIKNEQQSDSGFSYYCKACGSNSPNLCRCSE
jgi:hypothetical protein